MPTDKPNRAPEVSLVDKAGFGADDMLSEFCRSALREVLESGCGPGGAVLAGLDEVVVALVDDARMAVLHEEFSGVAGATDVLTFQHGEIVVGVETAAAYAGAHGIPIREEVARCILHGLLHLHGWEDASEPARTAMHDVQERLLKTIGTP